jgi:predicted phosphodiesterase
MRVILSDIHGNLEALEAVLTDAEGQGAEEVVCLGELVGYGPDPLGCIERSMSWPIVLQGAYDFAVLDDDDLSGWSAVYAARSLLWVRSLLGPSEQGSRCRTFLAERPRSYTEGDVILVHATPHNPLNEYLQPEDVWNEQKMRRIGNALHRHCFGGHTHIPGVFVEDHPGTWRHLTPNECGDAYRFDSRKTICNVGSVGQPHDGAWRASYVLFDGEVVRFRRVEYDVEATVKKIRANPELDDWLGDRLRDGR